MKVLLTTVCGARLVAPMFLENCPALGSEVYVAGMTYIVDRAIHYGENRGVSYNGAESHSSSWRSNQTFSVVLHVTRTGQYSHHASVPEIEWMLAEGWDDCRFNETEGKFHPDSVLSGNDAKMLSFSRDSLSHCGRK